MSKGSIRQISEQPCRSGPPMYAAHSYPGKKDNKTIYINLSAKNKLRN